MLSQYQPLTFTHQNVNYSSSEQTIQHVTALKFKDHKQAQNIINASDCGEMKDLVAIFLAKLLYYLANNNFIKTT